MINLILVTNRPDSFCNFTDGLKSNRDVEVTLLPSREDVFEYIQNKKVDVIVADKQLADCTGLDLLSELIKTNPILNCALVSELPPEEFHEVTEGLGLFMQLPLSPGEQDANEMMEILSRIGILLENRSKPV